MARLRRDGGFRRVTGSFFNFLGLPMTLVNPPARAAPPPFSKEVFYLETEMIQKSGVVFEEHTQIGDAVFKHC